MTTSMSIHGGNNGVVKVTTQLGEAADTRWRTYTFKDEENRVVLELTCFLASGIEDIEVIRLSPDIGKTSEELDAIVEGAAP